MTIHDRIAHALVAIALVWSATCLHAEGIELAADHDVAEGAIVSDAVAATYASNAEDPQPSPAEPIATPPATDGVFDSTQEAPAVCPRICCNAKGAWNVGAGVYFLSPRWTSNPGTQTVGAFGTGVPSTATNLTFGPSGAPYVWAEYSNPSGFGFRTQWFNYSDISGATGASIAPVTPGVVSVSTPLVGNNAATSVTAQGRLALNVFDFESTGHYLLGRTTLMLSGGARYAHLAQGFTSTGYNPASGGVLPAPTEGHNFNGAGPTVAILARRGLARYPNLGFYGRARAAILYGSTHEELTQTFNGATTVSASSVGRGTLPITELEAGVDWRRDFGNLGLFFQTGVVAQTYYGAGNSSNTSAFGGVSSLNDTSNLGLIGLRLTGGFAF